MIYKIVSERKVSEFVKKIFKQNIENQKKLYYFMQEVIAKKILKN
jgi:hypothetical protein